MRKICPRRYDGRAATLQAEALAPMGGHLVLEIVFRHISEIGKEPPTLAVALTLHWGGKKKVAYSSRTGDPT